MKCINITNIYICIYIYMYIYMCILINYEMPYIQDVSQCIPVLQKFNIGKP